MFTSRWAWSEIGNHTNLTLRVKVNGTSEVDVVKRRTSGVCMIKLSYFNTMWNMQHNSINKRAAAELCTVTVSFSVWF